MTKTEINALPLADAEQRHVVDEIEHGDDYEHFQRGDYPTRCGENCACQDGSR